MTLGYAVRFATGISVLILVGTLAPAAECGDLNPPTPNVLVFIMDDVGMGDIGCFGNDTIKTPNIDGLARDGARLTHHLAMPMCTPSRAALMTGRLPIRYGVEIPGRTRVLFFLSAYGGLPSNENTIAELLKEKGYATALIGKWHLGITCEEENSCSDPNSQGFDYFYGHPLTNLLDCGNVSTIFHAWAQARGFYTKMKVSVVAAFAAAILLKAMGILSWKTASSFILIVIAANGVILLSSRATSLGCMMMENREVVEQPLTYDHLTERLHSRAIQFMENHQHQPFLLVMSFIQAHTELFNMERFRHHSKHGRYGDNLEEMDWSVGQILSALKKLGLEENTLVFLTSDNGGHVEEFTDEGERQGGWNGIYKGSKGSTWEGGIRVPAIIKLPGVIPPGTVVSQPTHLPDVLPTVAGVTGVKLPTDRIYDGRDLMPLLTNRSSDTASEFMFHYCAGFLNAVRYTPKGSDTTYKLHYRTSRLLPGKHGIDGCFYSFLCQCEGPDTDQHNPPLIYDITRDPSETKPLDGKDPQAMEVIAKVTKAVSKHQSELPLPQSGPWSAWINNLPRPWARPTCGNFPTYTCADPYLDKFKSMKTRQ